LETLATSNFFAKGEDKKKSQVQIESIYCLRGIANTTLGMEEFKKDKEALKLLVLFLDHTSVYAKGNVVFLLAQFCTIEDENYNGFDLVLQSLNYFKLIKREKFRFETLAKNIKEVKDPDFKFDACCLVNGLISGSENETHRLRIQKELVNQGLLEYYKEFIQNETDNKNLYEETYDTIKKQMEYFISEIEESLEEPHELNLNDFKDPLSIAQVLTDRLEGTDAFDNLMNILTQLLLFSRFSEDEEKRESQLQGWEILENLIAKSTKKE